MSISRICQGIYAALVRSALCVVHSAQEKGVKPVGNDGFTHECTDVRIDKCTIFYVVIFQKHQRVGGLQLR